MASLRAGLSRLPQAHQDRIRDTVLAFIPSTTTIDDTYKPPYLLSLDHTTRESFCKEFYGGATTFKFNHKVCDQQLFRWLKSLSDENLDLLRQSLRLNNEQAKSCHMRITRIVIRGQVYNICFWYELESEEVFALKGLLLAKSPSPVGSYPVHGQPRGGLWCRPQ